MIPLCRSNDGLQGCKHTALGSGFNMGQVISGEVMRYAIQGELGDEVLQSLCRTLASCLGLASGRILYLFRT
jgi:hypothetical protein